MLEIKFDVTKARRIKFVFEEAYQDRPSIGDIRVYKEDMVANQMKNLFTNGLMNEVSEAYNTIEKLEALEAKVNKHPLASVYQPDIQQAKDIINNELQTVKTVVAEQHGNRSAHTSQNLKFGFGNNNQPTGVVAKPGDTVVVYVDAESGQPLPQLVFSQQEGSFANWGRTVSLHAGKNVITVPEVSQNGEWYRHSVTPGGAVYIVNPYTEEEQGKAPVIRFSEGVELFPMMDANTNEQEFLDLLKDYKARVDADKEANPDVLDREMIDVVEIVSDHLVFTGTATGAYEAYVNQGFSPMETVTMYNEHMDMVFNYLGLDGSNTKNDVKYTRENIRLAQPFGYMYAAGSHIGVQGDVMVSMLTRVGGWGVDHEIGHRLDIPVRTVGEVTNNMIPQYSSYYYGRLNKRIPFESHVFKNVIATNNNSYFDAGYFEKLAVFWQLEMVYPGYWGKLNQFYRENNVVLDPQNSDEDKFNQLAKSSSIALGLDLTEHFERHGFKLFGDTKEVASQYPKPESKIWYADYGYIEYEGTGFDESVTTSVDLTTVGETLKLTFNVNEAAKNDVMGYEIFKNDELIGFTSTNTFIDETAVLGESVNYTVIPYDKTLKTGDEVTINSLTPHISLQQSEYTIALNESFDPATLVKATNYLRQDITSKVTVNGTINEKEKGSYPIELSVTDEGVTATKTIQVHVVSEYDYLSDMDWESGTTQYGTITKNNSIKGRVNEDIKSFDKGIRAHANATITYDLSNTEYDYFEALLGVDMNVAPQNHSSLKFIIKADDQIVATTDVMKHADNLVPVKISLQGVQKLVIEVSDADNGRTNDYGIIVNPKLTTNNAKPQLIIPKDSAVKVGESLEDIIGIFTATDAEDGELTESVKVAGVEEVNFNHPGTYTLTYSVTDSDGNQVTKTRKISVVDMNDFKYLTDYDWKSAKQSYGSAKKDTSASRNDLRLTSEDKTVVTYEHGIGAHATSTIIYDLSDKDYQFFSSYVGVDRQMYGSVGSVVFQVYVDGEKQFDSGLMNSRDPQQYVEVNLAGAKELKLVVTDGGNGIGSDHGTWGDTKLHFANSEREGINRESLDALLQEIDSLTASDYTEASWLNLTQVLEEVRTQLVAGYNQDKVDELTNNLQTAYDNLEMIIVFDELIQLITIVEEIDFSIYTSESVEHLQAMLGRAKELVENATRQTEVDQMIENLQMAINQLENFADLNQVVEFKDEYLKAEIIQTLNLQKNEITIGDLLTLTSLTLSSRVKNLEGLQYAKNLESIEFPYAAITDLSPLKDLTKLSKIVGDWQLIEGGMLDRKEQIVTVDQKVINRQGERILPSSIMVRHNRTFTEMEVDLSTSMDENGVISLDTSTYEAGVYSVFIVYENEADNYQAQFLYMFQVE